MTARAPFRFNTILLALLSMGLVVLAATNLQQRRLYQLPDDGVSWVDSPQGVAAWLVQQDGPGYRAGIRDGDKLESINGGPIRHWAEASQAIFSAGLWSRARYELWRQGKKFETTVVITPQTNPRSIRYYLVVVGLLYLLIGGFVLLRRWSAPKSVHFYVFCLASFVLYTFSYTGKLNLFDTTIYWLNVLGWILQPALFLHFCLSFPERPGLLRRRSYVFPLLYVPGALLLATHVLVVRGIFTMPLPPLTARWVLDARELAYLAAYFLGGAMALLYSYRRAQTPLLKQQLKWVTRGTFVAIVPFSMFYALPYVLGFVPTDWMKLSVLSLVFLPVAFGYAIVRYRLMDADIIFQRGVAYTLATATIITLYCGLVALFADFFRKTLPITSRGEWIVAIIVTALLFQPLVNWIQSRLDRFFRNERYDYRRTLLGLAQEITSELHLDRLIGELSERLSFTLGVDRLAVFLTTDSDGFRLVKSRGFAFAGTPDLSFLDPQRPELQKGYLFFDSVKPPLGLTPGAEATVEQLDLHYYLPFRVKERTLGYLGLGKTRGGDFLSSQDVDLLQTIAGYVTIALENARLFESLEQKALQYQAVKEFSENIIESINIGVIAFNLEHRVESWNSSMEKLYGRKRAEVTGQRLEDIFPAELLVELFQAASEHLRTTSLYKFRLRTVEGHERIVNASNTPLVGKGGQVIGGLLIFSDYTERVSLEDQLVQAEKLSSIGLLAAGVAHEVNTPLAVIASQAQMLAKQIPEGDPRSRTLDKVIKQAFRASEIVNSLLKFSRVSGSEYSELDLNRVIRETLSLAEPMLRASKISTNPQLTSDLPAVYGNAGKLQQVFMNLILNARDAMPRGGELTIVTESEDSILRIEVSDSGVGIPPDHLSRIFDPFFTTKSQSRGTGLGLAVTYGIIREHSGKIRVESAAGKGTSFWLEFPAAVARKAVNVS